MFTLAPKAQLVAAGGGGWHGWRCHTCGRPPDALYNTRELAQASLDLHLADAHHQHRHGRARRLLLGRGWAA